MRIEKQDMSEQLRVIPPTNRRGTLDSVGSWPSSDWAVLRSIGTAGPLLTQKARSRCRHLRRTCKSPDWPISNWGHERYDISHSVFVTLALTGVVGVVFSKTAAFRDPNTPRFVTLAALAWLSILLLDTFYGHGRGIAMFWPFSDGRLNLGIPWFQTPALKTNSVFDLRTLKVFGVEFLFYFPILAVAVSCRSGLKRGINGDPKRSTPAGGSTNG